ncbi:hypothetical protein [Guyparkeria sp.]|uniref:hypothetical protein n=1 Tax=Guyparkeria sp. TaxID=2035736 RepID=UPI0039709ECE
MEPTNHDQTAEHRQGVRQMNTKKRIEAHLGKTRRVVARIEADQRQREDEARESENRMAALREEAERAAHEAEQTTTRAQKATAEFNAALAKQRQRVAYFRANGAGAKATELERQIKRAESERDRRINEGLDRLAAENPDTRASAAGQGDAIDDEERRHRAELRRLELDREKRAAEHAAHIQALEMEAARAGLAEIRGE